MSNPNYLQSLVTLESSQIVAQVTWRGCGVSMPADTKNSAELLASIPWWPPEILPICNFHRIIQVGRDLRMCLVQVPIQVQLWGQTREVLEMSKGGDCTNLQGLIFLMWEKSLLVSSLILSGLSSAPPTLHYSEELNLLNNPLTGTGGCCDLHPKQTLLQAEWPPSPQLLTEQVAQPWAPWCSPLSSLQFSLCCTRIPKPGTDLGCDLRGAEQSRYPRCAGPARAPWAPSLGAPAWPFPGAVPGQAGSGWVSGRLSRGQGFALSSLSWASPHLTPPGCVAPMADLPSVQCHLQTWWGFSPYLPLGLW